MAEFVIRNNLNPHKAVKCTISFKQVTSKNREGEPLWFVELATSEKDKNGNSVRPVYIDNVTEGTLDAAITKATAILSDQIDWSPLIEDNRPPFVVTSYPDEQVVDINSLVTFTIRDIEPSDGIDPDSITMTVNGLDVTDELELVGSPFEYSITWKPKIRVKEYE